MHLYVMPITTMQCERKLLDFLTKIGKKGESYQEVIVRVSNEAGYKDELKKAGLEVEK